MSLGKGINALFVDNEIEINESNKENLVKILNINDVEPNRNQARKIFDDEKLKELSESIKKYGVLQPIIVTKKNNYYEIIAGERRWRASILAGKKEIPAIIKEDNKKENAKISLIENLQRENLNPIERAKGFKELIDVYGISTSDLAASLGLNSTRLTETIKLLSLHNDVIMLIEDGKLPERTAKLLLQYDVPEIQKELALYIVEDNVGFAEAQRRLGLKSKNKQEQRKKTINEIREHRGLEKKFREVFKTNVKISDNKNNKGKIVISYTSNDDLDRIVELINQIK